MVSGLTELFAGADIPARVQGLGGRFGIFFGSTEPVERFDDTLDRDVEMRSRFVRAVVHGHVATSLLHVSSRDSH